MSKSPTPLDSLFFLLSLLPDTVSGLKRFNRRYQCHDNELGFVEDSRSSVPINQENITPTEGTIPTSAFPTSPTNLEFSTNHFLS